jgi:hypothetical protein
MLFVLTPSLTPGLMILGISPPPFSLLPRVIAKIQKDKARGHLVVPHWEGVAWWQPVMEMSKAVFKIPEEDPYCYPAKPTLLPRKTLELWLISF